MDRVPSNNRTSQRINGQPDKGSDNSSPLRQRPSNRPGIPDTPNTPNSPDTVVSFASFQRSQTNRLGRPENTGALSGNPRVERQMQQLCNELEDNAGKIKTLKERSANSGRAGDGARLKGLYEKKRQLAIQLKDCMRLLDPDLSGTIMERVKSQATQDLEQTYLRVWDDYQRTQKQAIANTCGPFFRAA